MILSACNAALSKKPCYDGRLKGREEGIEQGLEQGLKQGLEQGLVKGLEEGALGAAQKTLQRQLQRRFQVLPDWVLERIAHSSETELELWLDQVLDAGSIESVFITPASGFTLTAKAQ